MHRFYNYQESLKLRIIKIDVFITTGIDWNLKIFKHNFVHS